MIDYSGPEFLGIFLIGFPAFLFLTICLQKGIYWMMEDFKDEEIWHTEAHIFHHRSGSF